MGIQFHRVYKKQEYPMFYYEYKLLGLNEITWVTIRFYRDEETRYLFGIDGDMPHSRKFNDKVRRIIKAMFKNPLGKLTIIRAKDINENLQTILDFINKETR